MPLAGVARHTTPEAPEDLVTAAGLVGLRRSAHCLLWPLRSVGVVSEHHLWPGRAETLRADRAARAAPGPGDLSATQLVQCWSREGSWANFQAAPRGRGQGRRGRGAPAPAARPGVPGLDATQDGAPAAPPGLSGPDALQDGEPGTPSGSEATSSLPEVSSDEFGPNLADLGGFLRPEVPEAAEAAVAAPPAEPRGRGGSAAKARLKRWSHFTDEQWVADTLTAGGLEPLAESYTFHHDPGAGRFYARCGGKWVLGSSALLHRFISREAALEHVYLQCCADWEVRKGYLVGASDSEGSCGAASSRSSECPSGGSEGD